MSGAGGHIDERIPELLLGDLDDEARIELEAHVAGCERCARELGAATEAFAAIGFSLDSEPPPPALRARILGDARPPRLHAMLDKLAAVFDVTRARARALLEQLDDPAAWKAGPMAGSWLMFLDGGGARVQGATLAFVKLDAGLDWPLHRHLGREDMLVLSGGFRQDDGVEVHAGTLHVMPAKSQHAFRIFDDEPCISAVVLFDGVEFLTGGFTIDLDKR